MRLFVLACLIFPTLVTAGKPDPAIPRVGAAVVQGNAQGLVTYPLANNGVFMFNLGPPTISAGCVPPNQGALYRWAVDLSTPGGVAQMKLVMAAYARGQQIFVAGTGTCNLAGNSEDVYFLYINH